MTCETALELISASIDNELTEEEQAQLQAHLQQCSHCRAAAETLAGLDKAVSGLNEPAPEGLKQGVMYRIGQQTGKYKPAKRRWFGPGTGFGLVAAVLVLLIGTGVISLGNKHLRAENAAPDTADVQYSGSLPASPEQLLDNPATGKTGSKNAYMPQGSMTAGTDMISPDVSGHKDGPSLPPEEGEGTVSDTYYRNGGSQSEQSREPAAPMDVDVQAMGAAFSQTRDAAVLLYTEFDRQSLLTLLEQEEPKLLESLAPDQPELLPSGYLACKTDYRSLLALHEWLLSNLPQSEQMPAALREAETATMIRMEALDPGSGSLYSIITWTPRQRPVQWPAHWPADWASHLRTGENWGLFFPAEDYSPTQDAAAWLIFPPER